MKHFSKDDIEQMPKIKRLNIINSITGIKPANLIGSIDLKGNTNLAIFSSVVHLGSNPALLGFILRPQEKVRRHSYENIIDLGFYTLNQLPNNMTLEGHFTSAKFEKNISEFDKCNFTPEYLKNFNAPFVKESLLKIGLKYVESIPIPSNGTIMIVGKVEQIHVEESALTEEGYINLEKTNSTGISGLNSYYKLQKIDSYPYARPSELPSFIDERE